MYSLNELRFAQRFPFSSTAISVVKSSDLALESIPERILERAATMLLRSLQGKPLSPKGVEASKELLLDEVLAFPTSKIIASILGREHLFRALANSTSKSTFRALEFEENPLLFDVASELGLGFSISDSRQFLVSMPLQQFISFEFSEDFMKLVNQGLSRGVVYLERNDFIRVVSAAAGKRVLDSLPVEVKGVPRRLKDFAAQIEPGISSKTTAHFSAKIAGAASPESFPPCMSRLHGMLAGGRHLSHSERFNLSTFLIAVNHPLEELVSLYAKQPNFKERLTRYHLNRIKGRGAKQAYSPASCAKMRSYKLCFPDDFCSSVRHPLQYYKMKRLPPTKELKKG